MRKRPQAPRGVRGNRRFPQNGPAIREFRLLIGWLSTDLATELGISQPTLSNIEREQRTTSHELLDRIADALGVDRRAVRRENDPNAAEKEEQDEPHAQAVA
jgi:transcriptional regulator with XRE-family HTH domain